MGPDEVRDTVLVPVRNENGELLKVEAVAFGGEGEMKGDGGYVEDDTKWEPDDFTAKAMRLIKEVEECAEVKDIIRKFEKGDMPPEEYFASMTWYFDLSMIRSYRLKPFAPAVFRKENIGDVTAVLTMQSWPGRIRPKRKRKLLMAMGFSRNEARKLAFRGGADWRYRAEK